MGIFNAWDFSILDYIQAHLRNGFLDATLPYITRLADNGYIWIFVALLMLISKKYRKYGIILAVSLIFSLLFCNLSIKPLVARVRPFYLNPIELLIPQPSEFSFPSGHTSVSFAALPALFLANKRFGIGALVLSVIIAFSRVYLYVHYPTDIIGGIIIGLCCAFLAVLCCKPLLKALKIK